MPVEVAEAPHEHEAVVLRVAQRLPPAASAVSTSSSTCSLLSADSPTITSRSFDVSAMACGAMKPSKNGSATSMAEVSSLMIMRVAFSSVNCGSNEKPSLPKNSVVAAGPSRAG